MAVVSYKIYDLIDGEIRFSGIGEESTLPPVGPGQALVKGDPTVPFGNPNTHRVDLATGKDVLLTTILPTDDKIRDLADECARFIEGGFVSSALGSPHLYPSTGADQTKLLMGGSLYCRDGDGHWARLPHDQDQLNAVRESFVTMQDASMSRLDILIAQAKAASSTEELDAIQWSAKSDATQRKAVR